MIFALCVGDLRHEKILNLCMTAAITAVLSPLLLLFSLRYGILSNMEHNLNSNPQNLEIRMLSGYELDDNFFKAIRQDPHTGFVVEMTRALSVSADVGAMGKIKSAVECIPTAAGDPVFSFAHIPYLKDPNETAVSAALAEMLGIKKGDVLRLSISRIRDGNTERSVCNFKVAGIIPNHLSPGFKLYLKQEILTAMEDYRDGFEPDFFSDGSFKNNTRRSFAKARLYAKDLASVKPLSARLSAHFNISDALADIEELKNLTATLNFIFITVASVSVAGVAAAIGGLLFASLSRKERALALLRTEGMSQGGIIGLILLENFLIASAAFVCSLLLYLTGSSVFAMYFSAALREGTAVCALSPLHLGLFYLFTLLASLLISSLAVCIRILPASPAMILRR